MKKLLSVIFVLCICACGLLMPVPDWKDKAGGYLEEYKSSFLKGKELSTEPHFAQATREIAAGNDLRLLAVAYLTKYALHTASLECFDDSEFLKIERLEPDAEDMAYYRFLQGNFTAVDASALPARYTGLLKAAASRNAVLAAHEISAIGDPLSRLVAAGVWVNHLPCDEKIIQTAIDTASANGWQRPLWAYLEKLHTCYLEGGDKSRARAIKNRLELLKKEKDQK
ncbi:MAG: hypothetical protein PHN98_03045 [Smithellaceae bacterium]|nr:hypothetical protein [Smithellaceae bacterium]